jgi:hypothetical protein
MHDQFLSHGPNGAMVKQRGKKSAIDYFSGPHPKKLPSARAFIKQILKETYNYPSILCNRKYLFYLLWLTQMSLTN